MSEHDQSIARVVDEAYKAFADGKSIHHNPYTRTYWKINEESIGEVWSAAFKHAQAKAQTESKSTEGKVLGHVDLSKFK